MTCIDPLSVHSGHRAFAGLYKKSPEAYKMWTWVPVEQVGDPFRYVAVDLGPLHDSWRRITKNGHAWVADVDADAEALGDDASKRSFNDTLNKTNNIASETGTTFIRSIRNRRNKPINVSWTTWPNCTRSRHLQPRSGEAHQRVHMYVPDSRFICKDIFSGVVKPLLAWRWRIMNG